MDRLKGGHEWNGQSTKGVNGGMRGMQEGGKAGRKETKQEERGTNKDECRW